jgi:DNA polymerase II
MYTIHGWLLDLYTHPRHGKTCLWIIQQDGTRTCLQHTFPGIFYVSGTAAQLQRAENYLYARFAAHMQVTQEHRQQTIQADGQPVLAVRTPNPLVMQRVFHSLENELPALDYYNVDLNASLYYAAQYGLFALCRLSLQVDERQHMLDAAVEESPWNLDTAAPPLRIMRLVPNHNPRAQPPTQIMLSIENQQFTLTYQSNEELARKIAPFLRRYDPDVLLTDYGDGYLLHALQVGSEGWIEPLPLNRDLQAPLQILKERSYHSYGQLFYRPQAVFLSGRHHIDMESSFFWQDSGLEGILEVARVTAQSLQRTARTTPGTGISSMQIVEALRSDILVPYKKQIPERERSAVNLLQHDMGGLIMQPIIGLHANVGAVDFISMYPSLMVRCNISPECVPHGLHETHDQPGLIPRTLAPLLDKRVKLKLRMQTLADKNPQKQYDKMRSEALKWLLVTCFGYLGYKNARFGRIESHEAVTGAGREALLLAKEVAEEMDFLVLHAIVDSLFVQRADCTDKTDFDPLLDAIAARTGLPIGTDGVFRWVAFPPSRMDARVSVPNRYFGVFQDGSLKVRGIEARRRDVPPFIKDTQMEALRILAQAPTLAETSRFLPEAFDYSARRRRLLALNRVEPSELVIRHKLSRALEDYRMATPASIAARELLAHGKDPQPGEVIHFLHTRGNPPARLWQPGSPLTAKDIDPRLYLRIFDRAMETILGLFEERFPEVRKAGHQYALPVKNARPLLPHLAK